MPGGVHQWTERPYYKTYKSPHGPNYQVKPNLHGVTFNTLGRYGLTLGAFGAVAGFGALFFLEGVPRVRRDILQKVPGFGDYWIKDVPPSDNPF